MLFISFHFQLFHRWVFRIRSKKRVLTSSDAFSSAVAMESADVRAERGLVSSRLKALNLAVDDLTLVYKDGKRAVDHLSFGTEKSRHL